MELIRKLWDTYEEQRKAGRQREAIETCCQLTQLLMGQVSIQWNEMMGDEEVSVEPTETIKVCIAMMKAAGSIQVQLDAISPHVVPGTLVPVLEKRLGEVQETFGQLGQQANAAAKLHEDILSQETELKEQQRKNTESLEKIKELTVLKETGLKALEKQIEEQKQRQEKADQACKAGKRRLTQWKKKAAEKKQELHCLEEELKAMQLVCEQELTENEALLAAMRSKTEMAPVDVLIEKARQQLTQIDQLRQDSNEQIRRIIEKIHSTQIPI